MSLFGKDNGLPGVTVPPGDVGAAETDHDLKAEFQISPYRLRRNI